MSTNIGKDLQALLGADRVRCDPDSLEAYSSDASIYRLRPQAVVLVEHEDDVFRTLEYARRRGIAVTPRGSGTSQVGGPIGRGIILDFARYRRILSGAYPPGMITAS